jgi:hypothetical protein
VVLAIILMPLLSGVAALVKLVLMLIGLAVVIKLGVKVFTDNEEV